MKLNHRFVVPADIETVWAAFNNVENLVPCVPGATLVSSEGDSFEGTVKVKLGPISMLYGGTATFLERDQAAGRIVAEAKGKDKRGNGTAGATVTAQLTVEGTGTAVEVTTDLSVTGKPAQFGRGVIQDVSDKILGQFVDCISAKLAPPPEAEAGSGADADAASGTPDAAATDEASEDAVARQYDVASTPTGAQADGAAGVQAGGAAASSRPTASGSAGAVPTGSGASTRPASDASSTAKPAELNLLSTVLPVLVRRYSVPIIVGLVVVAGIWIWRAAR